MKNMSFIYTLLAACILDLFFGDPRWFPHPVRIIGWFAAKMESFTRSLPLSERNSGSLTVLLVLLFTGCSCATLLFLVAQCSQPLFLAGTAFLLYTTIAARDLLRHAMQVHAALDESIEAARKQVALIVGRDTDQLNKPAVIRACVESVAENMSDGIIAPLFWATVGAVVALPAGGSWPAVCAVLAAMLYKAVSTMDSMFGYKNERYLHFGCCAARLDDWANLLPARISGLALVLAAPIYGGSLKNTWRILIRDRQQHASPNSGWPEAAAAGALGIQLGGESLYFGRIVSKPLIGDPLHLPTKQHILLVCRLVLAASLLCLLLFIGTFLVLIAIV
ncbi:MAG: adenosylcobinamide-phosphate synthase [Candidatus Electronema aureum]|uniref:Cobalamin biosynthesis protein CobD n=1 Tax=Candidatus Electronema aureum TaxID=2005002 RepID=A0A521FZ13_9BACT|nr:MAG: adenosylcobinamide-phosphate synthase [Candidatus Electronema aureum]